ncbi:MAG: hypothetical protein U5L96_04760 [Owenweeksia sp.]|nr:hypothetical protein [Owenweeksia sp.]
MNSYSGDTLHFRFKGTSTSFRGDIAIDEVQIISDPVNCQDPSAISFSNVTFNSADVGWTTAILFNFRSSAIRPATG